MEQLIEIMQHNLKYIRKELNLTMKDLAKELDITRQTVINWEHGKTKINLISYYAIMYLIEFKYKDDLNSYQQDVLLNLLRYKVKDIRNMYEFGQE